MTQGQLLRLPRPAERPEGPVRFELVLEAIGPPAGTVPSGPREALGSGLWVVHAPGLMPLFEVGTFDRGDGLEDLAEDGDPEYLLEALEGAPGVHALGAWGAVADELGEGVPIGRARRGLQLDLPPLASFGGEPPRLSFVVALPSANDTFLATPPEGVPLVRDDGMPAFGAMEAQLRLYDLGTEADEPPGMGATQLGRQPDFAEGAAEGRIRPVHGPTRTLPPPQALVAIDADRYLAGWFEELEVLIRNASREHRLCTTRLSPVLWVTHTEDFELLEVGAPATREAAALATRGDAHPWRDVLLTARDPRIGAAGVVDAPMDRPGVVEVPLSVDDTYAVGLVPEPEYPRLSLAMAVHAAHDALLVGPRGGVAMFDAGGAARPAERIAEELVSGMRVIDAGVEANGCLGASPGRVDAPPGTVARTAPDDEALVRVAEDVTHDLRGAGAGGLLTGTLERVGSRRFRLRLEHRGDAAGCAPRVGPLVYAMHDGSAPLFEPTAIAGPALEALAERADPSLLLALAVARDGLNARVVDRPEGQGATGALTGGQHYEATFKASPKRPWLHGVAPVRPSNDTFVALGERGIPLFDAGGEPRSTEALTASLQQALRAWDAGTEQNQAGFCGADQSDRQLEPDDGVPEGDGAVRLAATTGPAWHADPPSVWLRATLIWAPLVEADDGGDTGGDGPSSDAHGPDGPAQGRAGPVGEASPASGQAEALP